jgi:hypothetical protein
MSQCGKKTMPGSSLKLWHDHVTAEGRDDLARTTAWCLLEQTPGDLTGIRAALKAAVKAGDHLEVAKVVRLVVDGGDKKLVLEALPRTNPLNGMGETGNGVFNSAKAYAESKHAATLLSYSLDTLFLNHKPPSFIAMQSISNTNP